MNSLAIIGNLGSYESYLFNYFVVTIACRYFGFGVGYVYEKIGHSKTLLFSSCLISLSYTLIALSLNDILYSPLVLMRFYFFLVGQGSYGLTLSVLDINMKNYEESKRGTIVGLLTSGFGISSAFHTVFYLAVFTRYESVSAFILFMAFTTFSAGVISRTITVTNTIKSDKEELIDSENNNNKIHKEPDSIITALTEILIQRKFWILYSAFVVGTGCGLLIINNIGSIWISIGGIEKDTLHLSLVITLSISNFVGRLLFGILSDKYQDSIPRIIWLSIICFLMAFSHSLFYLFPSKLSLILLAIGSGLAYGGYSATKPILFTLYLFF